MHNAKETYFNTNWLYLSRGYGIIVILFADDIINATILGFENYVMHNQRKISVARNIEVREYMNEQIVEQEGK